jgi:septal ring factor EnvC (AmiA/AmiB activator)
MEGLHGIIAEQKAQIAKLESEAAAEKARVDELRDQLKALQSDRDAAIKEAAEHKGQLTALKDQNKQLLAKIGTEDKGQRKPKA